MDRRHGPIMGKRLFRIFAKEIPSQLPALQGMDIHLVLRDKKTYHGKMIRTEGGEVEVRDFLHGKHRLKISDISEIIYDKESAY